MAAAAAVPAVPPAAPAAPGLCTHHQSAEIENQARNSMNNVHPAYVVAHITAMTIANTTYSIFQIGVNIALCGICKYGGSWTKCDNYALTMIINRYAALFNPVNDPALVDHGRRQIPVGGDLTQWPVVAGDPAATAAGEPARVGLNVA